MKDETAWTAAQRVEEWTGEVRVNLLRLVSIALFYGYHLLNYHILKADLPTEYNAKVTGVALAWSITALAIHLLLSRRENRPHLKYLATTWDAFMITALLVISDGPKSPLLVLLFLLIATSALRLRLRLVWTATALAIASYAFLCGHAKWGRENLDWVVSRPQQVIFALGLLCAGLIAGQEVRQARRFARDYGERVRPESAS